MEDFEYRGFYCMYAPHPKLLGNWEISLDDKFIGRAYTKKECIKQIELYMASLTN